MKIVTYGVVILSENQPIRIEGWNVAREPSDPPEASNEELLLATVIDWAKQKFDQSVNHALKDMLRRMVKTAADAQAAKKVN